MKIKNIKITNFKSLYGTHEFDFESLEGLVKLSGPIGAGKTSLGEAIIYGLYGTVKSHKNPNLIAWNTKSCCIEINLISKNKEIRIVRDILKPLEVYIDDKMLAASGKRDMQSILEEEIYDVPKLAIERMCIISFNQFNSLASMNPGQTKEFLDNIFGFKTFTEYNDAVNIERKYQISESDRLNTILNETRYQIEYLNKKKADQQHELSQTIDINKCQEDRDKLIEEGKTTKKLRNDAELEYRNKNTELTQKLTEVMVLGKQEKEWYSKFKSGKCPTCGQTIEQDKINESKERMLKYADEYKNIDKQRKDLEAEYSPIISQYDEKIKELKEQISEIDHNIKIYNNNLKLVNENYDSLIEDNKKKIIEVEKKISETDIEIGEWNEMNDLFSKTLRYKLLSSLIPQINNSIQYFINKLELDYTVSFDQEFKSHITIEGNEKQIHYTDLSTGQKKSIDVAIIFGIIQNIIANVNFNIFFLDELFSNMDTDARNNMLMLLKESVLSEDRTIFVINHSEMADDFFNHKIRVKLERKKIPGKKDEDYIVKASKYENIF
jgi:chromosome segregation ATPase